MAAPAKFLFDMDFSAPDKARERPATPAEIAQKVASAEARAYRDGYEAAQREAKAESDRRGALALEEIGIAIKGNANVGARLAHLAEHLTRAGLVEANVGIDDADRFEEARDAERGDVARQHRLREARHHETLGRQVVDLGGAVLAHDRDHGALVEQVAAQFGGPV